jgi:lipoprotein NlpD
MKQAILMQTKLKSSGLFGLLLSCVAAAMLSGCAGTKTPAPIEVRTPSSSVPPRAESTRRTETPSSGVTPPPASGPVASTPGGVTAPSNGVKPVPPTSGAETGTVKQGNAESRPLGPAPVTGGQTGAPPAAGLPPAPPVVSSTPIKSGPKAVKRPFSETVLAELKGADAPLAPTPRAASSPTSPSGTGPSASPNPPNPNASSSPAATTPPTVTPSTAGAAKPSNAPSFAWPIKGKVLANFSEPKQMGMPIAAAGDGKVIFSGPGPRGYGNLIIVKHEGELLSVYAHNKTLLVKDQESVKKGQKIAELGDSGTDSPKLHFEIRRQGKPVDPKQYLPAR